MYECDGKREVGKRRLEITEIFPLTRVTITLDMIKPFGAHNIVDFTLQARGDTTDVTWATMFKWIMFMSRAHRKRIIANTIQFPRLAGIRVRCFRQRLDRGTG